MQLKQCFTTLGLTIFTITSAATASLSQESTDFKSYQITFSCQTATDVITGEKHPTTVAFIPNKKANVKFIFWKSDYFTGSGWTRQKRCEIVSGKFQTALDSGRYYLVSSKNGLYPTICAVESTDRVCDKNSQLFQLEIGSNPELILQRIVNIQNGVSSSPIFQSSGGTKYYNIYELLEAAPTFTNN
ncbi:hypothetical protein CEP10_16300 [Cylindrospermopsis raciborskii S07]|uniref:COP23 domain-containing protein n=1 Tax=Cylindrospermopsis raciborskii TaxID=77022 RepID=UPI000C9DBB6B|nr:COP23 domain-containing protein [Cylindrospermopsis raciborskii]PNK02802.1 hypothetical protein CEP10_16300 [Cylindrospermopsis raciborskii S07]